MREREREKQAQGREGGEVELGARKKDIARREGVQGQGRAWGHRHKGEGDEGIVRGGEGRGAHGLMFIVHGSRFAVHGSRFTVHGSRFAVHCSRFTDDGSRFTIRSSRLTIRRER